MKRNRDRRTSAKPQHNSPQRLVAANRHRRGHGAKPAAGFRQRGSKSGQREAFNAPEIWHEPCGDGQIAFLVDHPGQGFLHPVTEDEVRERIEQLPARFLEGLETVHLREMTRKRSLFPCYGMQWGATVYLYPIEESLVETYYRPPRPHQLIEARMYGGRWEHEGGVWTLSWTEETIRDFYLNNVLIHEIGHIVDDRNSRFHDRERFANWFAIEYGYRVSRGRR